MSIDLSRRGFLTGMGTALIAAPAIVRASSLMPVKAIVPVQTLADYPDYEGLYAELADITRRAFVPRLYVQLWKQSPLSLAARLDPDGFAAASGS